MHYIQLLSSPFYQLALFGIVLVVVMPFSRFESKSLISIVFPIFILWMLVSVMFGFFVDARWTYFWQAGVSFIGFFVLFIGAAILAEKITGQDGGEAWMGFLALINIFVAFMIFSAIINGLASLVQNIFS